MALFTARERRTVRWLFALMLVGMVLETLGVWIVIPALGLITQPALMLKYPAAADTLARLSPFTMHRQAEVVAGGMIVLGLVYTIKSLFLAFVAWKQAEFMYGQQARLSQRLFSGYLRQPYTFHLARNSAQLIRNAISECQQFTGMVVLPGMLFFSESLVLLGIGVLLLAIEPVGAVFVIGILGGASLVFHQATRRRILRWGQGRQHHEGERMRHLQQGLGGAKEVKLLGREEDFLRQYAVHNVGSANMSQRQVVIAALPRLSLEWMAVIGLVALVLAMLVQGKSMEALVPTLGIFAAAGFRLMPSLNRVLASLQSLRYALPVINVLHDELLEIASSQQSLDALASSKPLLFRTAIELRSVRYAYPGSERDALTAVTLSIPRGSFVGFIGGSGAGKTTLVDVILGLLAPAEGEVLVDGVDVHPRLRQWQNQIGYVPQSIYLTDDTLRRNIAFGLAESEIDDGAVRRAIRAAQLEDFVAALPDGADTVVGERGVRLSGGQRQRIGIARALYHDPDVLVLDEATSALDVATERGIMEAVMALEGKTVLIVAHRLSTVANCAKLYRMENGRVVHEGAYRDVVNA